MSMLVFLMAGGLTDAERAEQLADSRWEAPKYARGALYFFCAGIVLFSVGNLLTRLRRTRTGSRLACTTTVRRATAAVRYLACSQPRAVGFIRFPTLGVILLITALWLFIGVWTFSVQPYYRSRWDVGSSPLAIRAGLFAVACYPFILAFGAKWNFVTFVTGYSHEKLQVFHQWLSHIFIVLSLIHTLPFIIQGTSEMRPNTDGLNPYGYSQFYFTWFVRGVPYFWSGFAALVPLIWLCWGSFAPFRNRFYETFKLLHVLSAIIFSGFFYYHCQNLLTSWIYLWATFALYGSSILVRFALLIIRSGRTIPRGTLLALPCGAVRLTLPSLTTHRWTAGQHYFLNFISALPFESHPYTIANCPSPDSEDRTMVVILRINPRIGRHETVLLLAGGAGASFITALLEEVCEGIRRKLPGVATKNVELVWAVRDEAAKDWFEDQIASSIALVPEGTVNVRFFVTGVHSDKLLLEKSSTSSSLSDLTPGTNWPTNFDRPDLAAIVTSTLAAVPAGTSVGIGSCGPTSFTLEVRNAVAVRQKLIMLGKTGGVGAEEVELFTEEFDW